MSERRFTDEPRATASEVVHWLSVCGLPPVSEITLRTWAHRGKIIRYGKRGKETLYDPFQVQSYAESQAGPEFMGHMDLMRELDAANRADVDRQQSA